MPGGGLVIVIYHRVGGRTPVSVDIPQPAFAEQLSYLTANFSPMTLDDAAPLFGSGGMVFQS